jgi:uncharacterized protein YjbI with pentapeptide repeats
VEETPEAIEWSDADFDQALKQAAEGVIQARGVRLSPEQVDRLLGAVPEDSDDSGSPHIKSADFRDATLLGFVDFRTAIFSGVAQFVGARFSGNALFAGARFSGNAQFEKAQFSGDAWFYGARFSRNAGFNGARFSGDDQFEKAQFSGDAQFVGARFSRDARFVGARFSGDAWFDGAQFSCDARFDGARFSGDARFDGAQFSGDARFVSAVFRKRITVGPILVGRTLLFDDAEFAQDVQLAVSASALSCCRTRFGGSATLDVRWAEVALEDAIFLQRSRLAGVGRFPFIADWGSRCRADTRHLVADERPRVVSLRQADVGNLTLGGVDLRSCRFFGTHRLDQLRIEADCQFAEPPRLPWYSLGRYTRRQTLAEEHAFRQNLQTTRNRRRPHHDAESASGSRNEPSWYPPECQTPPWLMRPAHALDPVHIAPVAGGQIAPLYRALRKAFEDLKDEPGAADFYYGEMEMRRHDKETPFPERAIIFLYWLVSGYGLRASRALLALAVTIIMLGAIPLSLWGFHPARSYGLALLFALQSSISLLRAPTTTPGHETAGGQVIEIFLRLAGPLFFGLALLALRGRVKR